MYRLAGLLTIILVSVTTQQEARAQRPNTLFSIALKSGESVEALDLGWIANCRSLLTATPTAEVMEGPSEIAVSVKEAMVVPRGADCNKPVKGAKLVLTAKEIEEYSTAKLTVRVTYKTKDGDKQHSYSISATLFPKQE